ncbi:MAG: gluconate 2-dehydrogenase subunit 3 family protein [Saprospiraceae bacterium]|nr:gluconate 2-dehydrogenase subunit 3 family protein [Saprospiraceae bacterium]
MKRREAIHKTGWILKSAVFGPGLVTALQSCSSDVQTADQLLVFSTQQYQLAKALSDTILPRTNSPSASDVKVPEFMDLLLRDVLDKEATEHLLEGLSRFEDNCGSATGQSFIKLTPEERNNYLVAIDRMVMGKNYTDRIPFYYTFKKLCINIYFSTEEGIKQNLNYNPSPGAFHGDVKMETNDLIEVGNET